MRPSSEPQDGLTPLEPGTFTVGATGKITEADGYTVLNIGQASARSAEIAAFSVPTADGAIRSQGLTSAFEGIAGQNYDEACDCITDTATGVVYTADNDTGAFVDESGNRLAQGWKVGVGFKNFVDVFTNPAITGSFFKIIVWNFAFALLVPAITFALGLAAGDGVQQRHAQGATDLPLVADPAVRHARRSPCCWSGGTCSTPTSA